MKEIQVGEYIRDGTGHIRKVTRIIPCYENELLLSDSYYIELDNLGNIETYKNNYIEEILYKHSKNIIDLIEDEDIAVLEYKSPKYRERIARRFEVSIIADTINFENAHCNFRCKIGDKKIKDTICKNIKIKEILTHEQYEQNCYKVEE